jgi:plasmid stabilization system protein ParE
MPPGHSIWAWSDTIFRPRRASLHARRPARRLIETYDAALARIAAEPRSWRTHPRPYPDLARYGFRWIKLHRYWFAWHPGPPPVITNIFDETADIPRRASDDGMPVDVACRRDVSSAMAGQSANALQAAEKVTARRTLLASKTLVGGLPPPTLGISR